MLPTCTLLLAAGQLWQSEWLLCSGGAHLVCGKLL
jgi:hypothetical protein